jgi:ABC-2 type transport system permease protein
VWRAKFEAVVGGTLMVFAPFLVVLLVVTPRAGVAAVAGILLAAATATAIQYRYRLQAYRGRIRRRQTASRFTTYAEALSSVSWAGTAALAAAGSWLAAVPAAAGALIVGITWLLGPSRR